MSVVCNKEPTKKRNAARMLYEKGKKCRVDCSGESYIFSQFLRVVNHVLVLLGEDERILGDGDTNSKPDQEKEFITLPGTCRNPSHLIVI